MKSDIIQSRYIDCEINQNQEGVNDGYFVSSHTATAIEREIQFNQESEEINGENTYAKKVD